jgi:cobalamin biosynthesis protein CobD/CbiB
MIISITPITNIGNAVNMLTKLWAKNTHKQISSIPSYHGCACCVCSKQVLCVLLFVCFVAYGQSADERCCDFIAAMFLNQFLLGYIMLVGSWSMD